MSNDDPVRVIRIALALPEGPRPIDWVVRDDRPHTMADGMPAGDDAWTDYRDGDRLLRRDKVDERAARVRLRDPVAPGERVRIERDGPYGWQAHRA